MNVRKPPSQALAGNPTSLPIHEDKLSGVMGRLASVDRHLSIELLGGDRALRRYDRLHLLLGDERLDRWRLFVHSSQFSPEGGEAKAGVGGPFGHFEKLVIVDQAWRRWQRSSPFMLRTRVVVRPMVDSIELEAL